MLVRLNLQTCRQALRHLLGRPAPVSFQMTNMIGGARGTLPELLLG